MRVKLAVYNLQGELVEVLKEGMATAGVHNVTWRASGYASGVYFYKLENGKFGEVKKMLLTK
jgi:flagellar hook assembly protein FlgD